jgi:hypothetical protein
MIREKVLRRTAIRDGSTLESQRVMSTFWAN